VNLKIALAQGLGYIVLIPACILHAWTDPTYKSIKPLIPQRRIYVDQWRWNWLNPWYANSEDGVSGLEAWIHDANGNYAPYVFQFPAWTPIWCIAWAWSAWRNGANNIKRPLRTDANNIPWA
jgi:hypothetical protein